MPIGFDTVIIDFLTVFYFVAAGLLQIALAVGSYQKVA
jgi:hypothetical protein